jgi:phosphatidylglycerol:prolipoprotein diacylglycerol transferase
MNELSFWQNIYQEFDPIAFSIGHFSVHWYGIMYMLALLSAFFIAKWIVKKDKMPISNDDLDDYIIWVEIGVIVGARVGYVLVYDQNTMYYLTHPWQMFNPFLGETFGIRGMSYHGAVVGLVLATYLYTLKNKKSFWFHMDLVALAVPLAYVFGRIGNFLNQELIGRAADYPWSIYVYDRLRHPSQLYEAFLEGIVVFAIIYWYRTRKRFDGELIVLYAVGYGVARFIAEFFREPDIQLGFIFGGWLTMGQLLSLAMIALALGIYGYLLRNFHAKQRK